jgi:hypothetical protein
MSDLTHCDCGADLVFDPTYEGMTCGGLHLIGALVCAPCNVALITRRTIQGGGKWAVASSGRSMVADGTKLRVEGERGAASPTKLLERIARLPDFEAALRSIARGDAGPAVIARRALESK